MHIKTSIWLFTLATLSLSGCAVRHYQAAPIVPSGTASTLEGRSLDDPGLRRFLEANLGHAVSEWPLRTWDLRSLTLAALYFNPAMDAARARTAAAQAAIQTAGARPNPTLGLAPGIPSPYLLSLDFAVPIETAGKRGYRILAAQNLDQSAVLQLAETAWTVRSGVRAALLNYLVASRNRALLEREAQVRDQQVQLLDQRFSVGEIPRPEVDLARIQLSQTNLSIDSAEGQLGQARAALAAAVGIPVQGFKDAQFSWATFDSPPVTESLSPRQIQADAVLNRLDVRQALAQYAAADAALRLEIAKQYPDLTIGPGYTYEEGNSFFTVGLSVTLPIFNRNQGPIAEAEARRREAAAAFRQKQAQVIADSEQALAIYAAAFKEFTDADTSVRTLQNQRQQTTAQQVSVGEEDLLTLNGVDLESSVLSLARFDALARTQKALGSLEDAVQRPLGSEDKTSLPTDAPANQKESRQ
jgi:outer membrane protein, heavy metal efflux system